MEFGNIINGIKWNFETLEMKTKLRNGILETLDLEFWKHQKWNFGNIRNGIWKPQK